MRKIWYNNYRACAVGGTPIFGVFPSKRTALFDVCKTEYYTLSHFNRFRGLMQWKHLLTV